MHWETHRSGMCPSSPLPTGPHIQKTKSGGEAEKIHTAARPSQTTAPGDIQPCPLEALALVEALVVVLDKTRPAAAYPSCITSSRQLWAEFRYHHMMQARSKQTAHSNPRGSKGGKSGISGGWGGVGLGERRGRVGCQLSHSHHRAKRHKRNAVPSLHTTHSFD